MMQTLSSQAEDVSPSLSQKSPDAQPKKNNQDAKQVKIRQLGLQDYESTLKAMHHFTDTRTASTIDEIWLVEHPHVFTQGQAGKAEHLLNTGDIPVVQSDRGGQVTYHGPGQLVVYFMLDLKRKNLGVRELVTDIENIVIATLKQFDIKAKSRADAPGVYVNPTQNSQNPLQLEDTQLHKICSLGLRIRHGYSFHGLALNVNMDLSPFLRINPCGYAGMQMTQISHFNQTVRLPLVEDVMIEQIQQTLNYLAITKPFNKA